MSHQRKRQLQQRPIEEAVRIAMSEFVGNAGEVDVERHSYDWRPDDLLVWVRLGQPISGSVLSLFRRQVAERMHGLFAAGQDFDDWLVVVECAGDPLSRVAWDDAPEEVGNEAGET